MSAPDEWRVATLPHPISPAETPIVEHVEGLWVNTHACGVKPSTPSTPSTSRESGTCGRSGPSIPRAPARARAHAARKAVNPPNPPLRVSKRRLARPSDPTGAGIFAAVVREAAAEVFHLAASRRIRIGYIACGAGEVLCGIPAALQPCLDILFAPKVTCWLCAALAERDGIVVGGAVAS